MTDSAPFAPWDDPNETPLIRFDGVTKRFGEFTAIDDIDLKIYAREFFALLGPSGCGKTTLMRMLAGFETVSAGSITLDGQDLVSVPPNKRAVNMMFQSYALFPHLTVAKNIEFGLKRSDMPRAEIGGRVDEMLALVQLEKFANRKPHQISGGQRQRVALARALAKAPKLLLLDEPLGALDKKLRQETQFELMNIQEQTGTTFVIVTHDQEEAMTVASRVAFHSQAGEIALSVGEGLPEIIAVGEPRRKDEACTFAIRPEKVTVTAERPADADNAMEGEVVDIAYLGNVSTYYVKVASGAMVKAQMSNFAVFQG